MHILCPHCHNPIEVVRLTSREEISCPACGSSFHLDTGASTSLEKKAGQHIGKFEILHTLGVGAFGTVYKARDPELDRTVAIKVPRAGNLTEAKDLDRFLREARSVAQLHHSSIVSVHEVGQIDGVPYLVSDFVEGLTLADLISARRPGFRESAELVAAVADGLHYAHERGVVHRDVKPSNVMLETVGEAQQPRTGEREKERGGDENASPSPVLPFPTSFSRVRILDFGLAKREAAEITMTIEGQVLGTPAYMSPEQARGEGHAVDVRGDVYSLGVVLYQLLTGELPFRGTQRMLLYQVLHDEPRSPRRLNDRIPRDLETICLKCLRKEPARRYQSAAALAGDLRRFLKGQPIVARPVGRFERTAKWLRRNPGLTAAVAAIAATLLIGSAISTYFGIDASHEAQRARDNEAAAKKNEADALAARNELAKVNEDLLQSRDMLELRMAQSFLRPLAVHGPDQVVTDVEWQALWELAANRGAGLGYRFVEQAARSPSGIRQLRDRAALALPAAVGLDEKLRADVEALMLRQLESGEVGDEHKADIAITLTRWDGLSSKAALRLIDYITRIFGGTSDPGMAFVIMSDFGGLMTRLEPQDMQPAALLILKSIRSIRDQGARQTMAYGLAQLLESAKFTYDAASATEAGSILLETLKSLTDPNGTTTMVQALTAAAARMDSQDARPLKAGAAKMLVDTMCQSNNSVALSVLLQSLTAVCSALEGTEARALATTFLKAIKESKDGPILQYLVEGLALVAGPMQRVEAAPIALEAADHFLQASTGSNDPNFWSAISQSLPSLAPRLDSDGATRVATFIIGSINLTQDLDPFDNWKLPTLSGIIPQFDDKASARVAVLLIETMKKTAEPNLLNGLLNCLNQLTSSKSVEVKRTAAVALVDALKKAKNGVAVDILGSALSSLSDGLDADLASEAWPILVDAIKVPKSENTQSALPANLAATISRLDRKRAENISAQVGADLIHEMKNSKDALVFYGWTLTLAALFPLMNAEDRASMVAQAAARLVELGKDNNDPGQQQWLGSSWIALAPFLDAKEAAKVAGTISEAMKDYHDNNAFSWRCNALYAVVSRLDSSDAAHLAPALISFMGEGGTDVLDLAALSNCLDMLAKRLSGADALDVARRMADAMKDTKDAQRLVWLSLGLTNVAGPHDRKPFVPIAEPVADVLTKAIEKNRDPATLAWLAQTVNNLSPTLKHKVGPAALALLDTLRDRKLNSGESSLAYWVALTVANVSAYMDTEWNARVAKSFLEIISGILAEPPSDQEVLIYGASQLLAYLPSLAERLEPGSAASIAAEILRIMKVAKEPSLVPALAETLATLAPRLDRKDAVSTAAVLLQLIHETKNTSVGSLAHDLAELTPKLEVGDAVGFFLQALKDTRDRNFAANPNGQRNVFLEIAAGLANVAARLDDRDLGRAAATLMQSMKDFRDPNFQIAIVGEFTNLLTAVGMTEMPAKSTSAASLVGLCFGANHVCEGLADLAPAFEAPSCRLSTQELVDLLKMPSCQGDVQRLVLEQLGRRCLHDPNKFRNIWDFVHFANEKKLELDFTSPPEGREAGMVSGK